jgi:N-acetylglucosaminyldiphosphoundecaprenol N-acetyl-beta-D-mannosaminyltransferase
MTLKERKATEKVVSLDISLVNYNDAMNSIIEFAEKRRSSYFCFANAHMTIEALRDKKFEDQVNGASLVFADGMSIVKALKFLYKESQERIAGMDMFSDLLQMAEKKSLRVFFFGSTPEILNKIKINLAKLYPRLEIAGFFSPPFDRTLDDDYYIDLIHESNLNILFIALGCPKQEKWMANHSHKISAPMLGVGGAFAVFAGEVSRAPNFMQKMGLEWLFRLMQEPKRLFARYLITNTLFIYYVLRSRITLPKRSND